MWHTYFFLGSAIVEFLPFNSVSFLAIHRKFSAENLICGKDGKPSEDAAVATLAAVVIVVNKKLEALVLHLSHSHQY